MRRDGRTRHNPQTRPDEHHYRDYPHRVRDWDQAPVETHALLCRMPQAYVSLRNAIQMHYTRAFSCRLPCLRSRTGAGEIWASRGHSTENRGVVVFVPPLAHSSGPAQPWRAVGMLCFPARWDRAGASEFHPREQADGCGALFLTCLMNPLLLALCPERKGACEETQPQILSKLRAQGVPEILSSTAAAGALMEYSAPTAWYFGPRMSMCCHLSHRLPVPCGCMWVWVRHAGLWLMVWASAIMAFGKLVDLKSGVGLMSPDSASARIAMISKWTIVQVRNTTPAADQLGGFGPRIEPCVLFALTW